MAIFSEDSNPEEVDSYLKGKYHLGLNWFHYRLSLVSTFESLRSKKRNLLKYSKKVEYLESFRSKILKLLKGLMSKSGLKADVELKRKYRKTGLGQEQLDEEIIKLFNLRPIFMRINEKIHQTKRRILMLQLYSIKVQEKKISIQPLTMLILVWLIAMKKTRKKGLYKDVYILLNWFKKNHPAELLKKYGRLPCLSEQAIGRYYMRYLGKPSKKQKIYKKIVFEFISDFDID